ncbi:MAG: hypothetical protein JWO37_1760 [Acidimicrobiales bacterium]|jgi:quercetin dioxygenase-like cupin family protein|nr:hypothetical protein [Acidimicrobiales bacterium]
MQRIVAGERADGTSTVLRRGNPLTIFKNPNSAPEKLPNLDDLPRGLGSKDVVVTELWATAQTPPVIDEVDPTEDMEWEREFPAGGTRWRLVHHGPNRVAASHRTKTLDYDVVLSGQLDLLLDDEEIRLGAGDCVLLPGVNHGWRAGPNGAVLLVVMIAL